MTARGTDWSLALLVALLFATGVLTLFAGSGGSAWVFAIHGAGGLALGGVLSWKLRRVVRRVLRPRASFAPGLLALALVAGTLGSGVAWSAGAFVYAGGLSLLGWHTALGVGLTVAVLVHALRRARRPRARDLSDRRQVLAAAAVAGGAYLAWRAQRPVTALFGWRGARRRFTGSYEVASFEGNAFPTTSWIADRPRPEHSLLVVAGLVEVPLSLDPGEVDAGDELVATLDCTGGFYSTQRWRGIRLDRLIARAVPRGRAGHVRVVSRTGYRWSFDLDEARGLLLATHVGGEPLSHEHGAPVRLVAPGRRGFQWVKWVARVELHDGPDPGAAASTVWSSFTAAGRGAA